MNDRVYAPEYGNSWALCIGINKYRVAPLRHARNDAEAVSELLTGRFGFPKSQVHVLLDEGATKAAIMGGFLAHTGSNVAADDRLVVFFAGHGYTHSVRRGEVGFLIPVDGDPADLSSLIRWDELTRNADLIAAKHILFVMDACYGGLAITRSLRPGSMRFLKDMLQRYSRQVLTAGKADEPVSDGHGPLAGHSVFTGHLLEGLSGKAISDGGALTANALMSYVYNRVSTDPNSMQTPHYGFLEGDGDFIFDAPGLQDIGKSGEGQDILVAVPPPDVQTGVQLEIDPVERAKEYLSESRYSIKLEDLVTAELRTAITLTSEGNFPPYTQVPTGAEFMERLKTYGSVMRPLQGIAACVSYWGGKEQEHVVKKIVARFSDSLGPRAGLTFSLALRWYPEVLLTYSAGVAAVAAGKYANLAALLCADVQSSNSTKASRALVLEVGQAYLEFVRSGLFKELPGYDRYHTPISEYLVKELQPPLEDLLFLGRDYEAAFDRFEVFQALVCADLRQRAGLGLWGPVGRYSWKYREPEFGNPFHEVVTEAETQYDHWPPLKSGLFGGSIERFLTVAKEYAALLGRG